ncbi:MAG: hypothetical protein MUF54_12795 [Polyangiaceae bacterium]|nr:hypothetical protein [Polyangiaceae bacterium]
MGAATSALLLLLPHAGCSLLLDGDALTGGKVQCTAETLDCDGDPRNGCEANPMQSPVHCGACNHDCGGGQCDQGRCLPVVLATGLASPWAVNVDPYRDGRVYWTNQVEQGSVCSVSKAGGTVTVHASSQDKPAAIFVDSDALFWVNSGSKPSTGAIMRVNITGGAPEVLVDNQDAPLGLTKVGDLVFWTNHIVDKGSVWSYDIKTKVAKVVSSPESLPAAIVRPCFLGLLFFGSIG